MFYVRTNDVVLLELIKNVLYLEFILTTVETKQKDSLDGIVGAIGMADLDLDTRLKKQKVAKQKERKMKKFLKSLSNNTNYSSDSINSWDEESNDSSQYSPGIFNTILLRCEEKNLDNCVQTSRVVVCVNQNVTAPIKGMFGILFVSFVFFEFIIFFVCVFAFSF